ncbi:enolase C-terminal domain-like protein [Legionella parisiensis]|uniref:N-succinyl-L-Arg/Lys racemase n=1 Tax=Legionella parisiensis TaxID=45071 RepID=A0A1E5JPS4_9GAMM|nr:enolase C-terminal domain-like protein [Legionella parisiensis]KTD44400.1 chloromuconate cycloisomerase [Legionella parisiensis]OEH46546.1 N-succinyl-L-Arg/Lys racemase [Legionella parisiensis]STX72027.1 chloromuconate cycloisomerase [Legionella parisiensis]
METSLKMYRLKYQLPQPFSIATHTWTHLETILVQLHYDHFIGIGEAAPFALSTGETFEYVVSQLQEFKRYTINPNNAPQVFYKLLQDNMNSFHASAALDSAFHDLLGKIINKPVYGLFGNGKNRSPNSVTIPVLGLKETKAYALSIVQNHPQVQLIKMKLENDKINPEIARIIKNVFAENVAYIIDPNQSFNDSRQAIEVLKEIQSILGTVIAIEQPVDKHDYHGLFHIKKQFDGVNIYADESVNGIDELEQLIHMNAVNGVNIKIQKAGGIWKARLLAQRAHQAGLKVMVGSMMEGPLSIAAGIHFASSMSNIEFTDLDSDLFLFQDLNESIFTRSPYIQGMRIPFKKPGLGIEVNERTLENLALQKVLIYEEL